MIFFSEQDMINLLNYVDDDIALSALNRSKTVEALVESVNQFGAALDQICADADKTVISDLIKCVLVEKASEYNSKHPIIANIGDKDILSISIADYIVRNEDGNLGYIDDNGQFKKLINNS